MKIAFKSWVCLFLILNVPSIYAATPHHKHKYPHKMAIAKIVKPMPATATTVSPVSTPPAYLPRPLVGMMNTFTGREMKLAPTWFDKITIGGGLISTFYIANHTPTNAGLLNRSPASSALAINFIDLNVNLQPTEWARGRISYSFGQQSPGFIYNPPGNGNVLYAREGYITLGDAKNIPQYMKFGLQYIPFGGADNTSVMEPIVRLMTLTAPRPALIVGINTRGVNANVYTFVPTIVKSASDKGETARLHDIGASISFAQQCEHSGYGISAGYINNMSSGLYIIATSANASTLTNGNTFTKRTPGLNLQFDANYYNFDASLKFVTALSQFPVTDLPFYKNGTLVGAKPAGWGLNLGYSFDQWDSRFAVGYQGSQEAIVFGSASGATSTIPATSPYFPGKAAGGLPKTRLYTNYTWRINSWASVSAELDLDQEYSESAGGTGKKVAIALTQLRLRV